MRRCDLIKTRTILLTVRYVHSPFVLLWRTNLCSFFFFFFLKNVYFKHKWTVLYNKCYVISEMILALHNALKPELTSRLRTRIKCIYIHLFMWGSVRLRLWIHWHCLTIHYPLKPLGCSFSWWVDHGIFIVFFMCF